MREPLFAIIVPTFNSAENIDVCLTSILNQTFTDFEIIVQDGFSSDNTIEITKKFANGDSRIKLITEPDKGVYDAMNKGIERASGKWIYFLGSDDGLFDNDVLRNTELRIYENPTVDVFYGNVYSNHFRGIYDGEFSEDKIFIKNICHQAIFYKKTVFSQIGNYNVTYRSEADWDHNFRWFLSNKIKHKYIDIIVSNFGEGGLSSNKCDPFFLTIKSWRYNLMRRNQIKFRDKWKILKAELTDAYKHNRKRNFITIISQIPYFFSGEN